MAQHRLALPPHLRPKADAAPTPQPLPDPVPAPKRATDMVQVTTPLGTVTCPPGRLKLNLLHGGMPKRGD